MQSAIIGCGGIAQVHKEVLLGMPQTNLSAVCDILPQRAQALAAGTEAAVYTNWEAMLEEVRPDVVHLCTPHYLHVPMAKKALAMGIHVLTEKPCAITLASLQELRLAQQNSTAQLGVCFQNRYNQSSRFLLEAVNSGEYGALKAARAFVTWQRGADYFNSAAWRGTWAEEGGGVMINQAIHTLDLMQLVCGGIRDVFAQTANASLHGVIEVEDTAHALFHFTGGQTGVLYATLAHGANAPVFLELQFEEAALRLERGSLYLSRGKEPLAVISHEQAQSAVGKSYWGDGHKALIGDFYDCAVTGRHFAIDAQAGGMAVQAVLGMYASAQTGETVTL